MARRLAVAGALVAVLLSGHAARAVPPPSAPQPPPSAENGAAAHRAVLDRYCVTCHNARIVRGGAGGTSPLAAQLRAAGLMLDTLDLDGVGDRAEVWERVVRKLRAGMMPPAGRPRPAPGALDDLAGWLEGRLDAAARRRPDPGRPAAVHRLNRAEYRNAVRDLLAVEVAVEDLLPADDSSHGFDNVGVALRLSESLLERYLAAARRVSRLAVGAPPPGVASRTYRIATDQPQHDRAAALPFGTRGGAGITHLFPRDADYEIAVELGRVRGDRAGHLLEVTVDGGRVALAAVGAGPIDPAAAGRPAADDRGVTVTYAGGGELVVRTPVAAGPRDVGVAFHRRSQALVEQVREPFRNPRRGGVAGPIPIVNSVTKVNVYHLSLFARFVEKLRATPDGDGTLLDHPMLLYGCGMGDGDHHTPFDLPVALVGGGAGRARGRPAPPVPAAHAVHEPGAQPAREAGRPGGPHRRQHRAAGRGVGANTLVPGRA